MRDKDVVAKLPSDADKRLSRVDDVVEGVNVFTCDPGIYLVEKGEITVDDGVVTGL